MSRAFFIRAIALGVGKYIKSTSGYHRFLNLCNLQILSSHTCLPAQCDTDGMGYSKSPGECEMAFVNRKTIRVRNEAKNLLTNGSLKTSNTAITIP